MEYEPLFELERFSGYAVCGFRGLWKMLFLMKDGII